MTVRGHHRRLPSPGAVVTVAACLAVSVWLVPAASAAPGDASAVGFGADFTAEVFDGTTVVIGNQVGAVVAPPETHADLTGADTEITASLGPTIGTVLIASASAISTTATSTGSGSTASATVTAAQLSTAAGTLIIDSAASTVSCPAGGPPTATVTGPTSVSLAGNAVDLDPSGVTVLQFTDPGPPGTLTITLTVPQPVLTSTSAQATGLVYSLVEDLTGLVVGSGSLELAGSSCVTPGPPIATGITPGSGPPSRSTTVTITGTGFVAGQTSVTFGGIPASSVTVNSDGTSLTLQTPTGIAPGVVPVVVTTPAGSSTDPLSFEYLPQVTTSGVLREAATGAPLSSGCVLYAPAGSTGQNRYTSTNQDGSWSFTSDEPGPFTLAFYTGLNGNCNGPIQSAPEPSWYLNQPLTGTDPFSVTPPDDVTAVASGTTGIIACLGAQQLPDQGCVEPTAALSGHVLAGTPSGGSQPVPQACIVILRSASNNPVIGSGIAGADGAWRVDRLPVGVPFVVGVLPPFTGPNGPCTSADGPPPTSPDGELQPEFYRNTWVDLTDQDLLADPFGWALKHGAQPVSGTVDGIDVCLTTTASTSVPRPDCVQPPPVTTTPTSTTSITATVVSTITESAGTTATAAVAVPDSGDPQLAATGSRRQVWTPIGLALITIGAALVLAGRRRTAAGHR